MFFPLVLSVALGAHVLSAPAPLANKQPVPPRTQVDDGAWRSLPPYPASMIGYDSDGQRLIGIGEDGAVWQFDLVHPAWAELPPTARYPGSAGSVFPDPIRHRLLVAGLDVVWAFDLDSETWSSYQGQPDPYFPLAIAFDAVHDRMLYDASFTMVGSLHHPTRSYDLRAWQWRLGVDSGPVEIAVPGPLPTPRQDGSAVFDPSRDRLTVFSGDFGALHALTLDAASGWDSIGLGGAVPDPANARTTFYDPSADRLICLANPEDMSLLSLSGTPTWTALPTTGAPTVNGPVAFDPDHGRLLMLTAGGIWEYPLADSRWQPLSVGGPAREFHTSVLDERHNRLLEFGGQSGDLWDPVRPVWNDVWSYDLASGIWSQVVLDPGPSARAVHTAVIDPDLRTMIVFGGDASPAYGNGGYLNDLWALNLDGPPAWQALAPSGTPPSPREECGGVYDPVDRRVVFGGGTDASGYLNDIWSLFLGPDLRWQRLDPQGPGPGILAGGTLVYDSRRHRVVALDAQGRAWAVNLTGPSQWQPLSAPAPTTIIETARASYDSLSDRLILAPGLGFFDVEQLLQLTMNDGHWSALAPTGTAPLNAFPAVAMSANGRRWFVQGGQSGTTLTQETNSLEFDPQVSTGVLVSLVGATVVDDAAHVVWQVAVASQSFHVERRAGPDPWVDRGPVVPDGSRRVTYDDGDLTAGVRYGYRLRLPDGATFGETWLDIPAAASLSLSRPMPDPASNSMLVQFSLARDATADLSVFDLNGRRALSQQVTSQNGAEQRLEIDVSRLRPGIYFLRLSSGRTVASRRIVVAR